MPPKKRALGRGLDALLGADERETPPGEATRGIVRLPIAQLQPNPFQPRKHFNPDALEELTVSIQEKGILQPLVVRRKAGERDYEIVAGERRWRASQRAGLAEVPVIVREFDDQEMLELALIENIQREELNPVEEARAYRQLIEEFELTQEQVAQRVGRSRVAITNALRLLRLPEKILAWIEDGQLTAGHGKPLLSLEKEPLQLAMCREIMSKGLSVRDTEKRVRRLLKQPDAEAKAPPPEVKIEVQDFEEKLKLHLGLQVRIHPRSNTAGRIEVLYESLDDFQRLFDHLGITLEQEI